MKWHILCLTEWLSFIIRIWVTTTFNRRWSISETLNSLTLVHIVASFHFSFCVSQPVSKLFNLKLLSNSWKQISRKLPKLKNLRNFHQTTREKSQEPICHRSVNFGKLASSVKLCHAMHGYCLERRKNVKRAWWDFDLSKIRLSCALPSYQKPWKFECLLNWRAGQIDLFSLQ